MELKVFYSKFLYVVLCLLGFLCTDIFAVEPSFDVPVVNITVVEGKTAILPCSVEHLGDHKVVWTDQLSTLLTFDTKRIIDDERMGIDRPRTKDWNLVLHDVTYADRGRYTCQINTRPIKIKTVELVVSVPPRIQNTSNQHVITKEGETVTLTCNVSGVPPPVVTWYKRPLTEGMGIKKQKLESYSRHQLHENNQHASESCTYTIHQTVQEVMIPPVLVIGHGLVVNDEVGMNGEILIIHNVSRYCDGIYECVAFNNVPPAVNKEITVLVEFSPEILLHNKRIGQVSGKETILECQITAFPQAISVWRFKGNNLMNSMKYRIDVYNDADHQITLSLRVMNITKDDFGLYTCFAENKLGRDQEGMILFDIAPVKTTSTTMKPTTTTIDHYVDYVETGEHLYKNNRHGSVHANGFEPGNNPIVPAQIGPDSSPSNGIVCSGGIIYICRPYAGHSSMGNTAVQSASPKNFITILTIILANLYYAS